jgi:hypothetical protein
MTSIVPNYSKPLGAIGAGGTGGSGGHGGDATARRDHAIVRDDYDQARRLAAAEGKALLVNFTGHT